MIEVLKQAAKILTLPVRQKDNASQTFRGDDCPYEAKDGESENIRALSFR